MVESQLKNEANFGQSQEMVRKVTFTFKIQIRMMINWLNLFWKENVRQTFTSELYNQSTKQSIFLRVLLSFQFSFRCRFRDKNHDLVDGNWGELTPTFFRENSKLSWKWILSHFWKWWFWFYRPRLKENMLIGFNWNDKNLIKFAILFHEWELSFILIF